MNIKIYTFFLISKDERSSILNVPQEEGSCSFEGHPREGMVSLDSAKYNFCHF